MGYTVLMFTANWCAPCGMVKKYLGELATEYGFTLRIVDVEQAPDLVSLYSVSSVPTLILFRNDQPVSRLNGGVSYDRLRRWIADYVRT